MNNDNLPLLRRFAEAYTAAWSSQNATSVATCYEEDGSLRVNEDAPAIGREAITEVAQGFMSAFPDMRVVMDDLVLQDEGVIYHWTLTGTNDGPGGSGRSVRISGHEVWQISANGLIAKSEGHFDAQEYDRQLGL
jgi:steroid delta-isomerase-like uncharacterized protein